jgi:hypothetical protein
VQGRIVFAIAELAAPDRLRPRRGELPVVSSCGPAPDRPGQAAAAVRHASERKRLEQALRSSEQRPGLLVDSLTGTVRPRQLLRQ